MLKRLLWTLLGCVSCAIGLVGLLLPIIPGILFLVFGLWCFMQAADASGTSASGTDAQPGAATLRGELQWDRDSLYRRRYR